MKISAAILALLVAFPIFTQSYMVLRMGFSDCVTNEEVVWVNTSMLKTDLYNVNIFEYQDDGSIILKYQSMCGCVLYNGYNCYGSHSDILISGDCVLVDWVIDGSYNGAYQCKLY